MSIKDAVGRQAESDRPPFGPKDDIRLERKAPDRNVLDRDRIVDGLKEGGVVVVFAIVVVAFSYLLPSTFPTWRNAVNVLNNRAKSAFRARSSSACSPAWRSAQPTGC